MSYISQGVNESPLTQEQLGQKKALRQFLGLSPYGGILSGAAPYFDIDWPLDAENLYIEGAISFSDNGATASSIAYARFSIDGGANFDASNAYSHDRMLRNSATAGAAAYTDTVALTGALFAPAPQVSSYKHTGKLLMTRSPFASGGRVGFQNETMVYVTGEGAPRRYMYTGFSPGYPGQPNKVRIIPTVGTLLADTRLKWEAY